MKKTVGVARRLVSVLAKPRQLDYPHSADTVYLQAISIKHGHGLNLSIPWIGLDWIWSHNLYFYI